MKVVKTDDRQLRSEVEQGLENHKGYCPCRLEHTPDTKCMCKEFRDQIAKGIPGTCHCGLYVAITDGESNG